jgi:hypothetical protein
MIKSAIIPAPGTTVVALPYDIEYSNAARVTAGLATAFAPGVATVVVDLTGCTFVDTAGVLSASDADVLVKSPSVVVISVAWLAPPAPFRTDLVALIHQVVVVTLEPKLKADCMSLMKFCSGW